MSEKTDFVQEGGDAVNPEAKEKSAMMDMDDSELGAAEEAEDIAKVDPPSTPVEIKTEEDGPQTDRKLLGDGAAAENSAPLREFYDLNVPPKVAFNKDFQNSKWYHRFFYYYMYPMTVTIHDPSYVKL